MTGTAIDLADTLEANGCNPRCLDRFDDFEWWIACEAATQRTGRPIGEATAAVRHDVRVILEERERHPDAFDQLPAGV